MPARPKRQVGTIRAGRDQPVPIIRLLLLLIFGVGHGVPAVGIPFHGIGEIVVDASHRGRGGEEDVVRRDDPPGVFNGHGVLDFAHDGMDGRVEAEGFADGVGHEGQFLQVVVREGFAEVGAKGVDLFVVKLIDEMGL